MIAPLTKRTEKLIELIADRAIRARVLALLEQQGALFGPLTMEVMERIRFAVVKLALIGAEDLRSAEELYCVDTRDFLVNAGFANDLKAQRTCSSDGDVHLSPGLRRWLSRLPSPHRWPRKPGGLK